MIGVPFTGRIFHLILDNSFSIDDEEVVAVLSFLEEGFVAVEVPLRFLVAAAVDLSETPANTCNRVLPIVFGTMDVGVVNGEQYFM